MTHLAFKTRLNFEPFSSAALGVLLPKLGHSDLTLSRITAVFRPTIYFEMAQN